MLRTSIIFLLMLGTLAGCQRRDMNNLRIKLSELDNISSQKWDELNNKNIYFGHQSVGFNILDGVKQVQAKFPDIHLKIIETKDVSNLDSPYFAHSRVGKNLDPKAKCDDFKTVIESGIGDKVDIAFFKLCYIDILDKTDINEVFNHYVRTIHYLENKYPQVIFLHVTVPLTTPPGGMKTKLKRFIGYPLWTDADNIKRNLFNMMLVEKYGNRVFDLAEYESLYSDGKQNRFNKEGHAYRELILNYASDDGHLNDIGQWNIGVKLLKFLQSF